MENKKQEAIRLAYGEQWEKVKNSIDENGWVESGYFDTIPNLISANENFTSPKQYKADERNDDYFLWRPNSLFKLEQNNGWISIESEDDLPTEPNFYWVMDKDKTMHQVHYEDININFVSHYQPIQKPKNPIF